MEKLRILQIINKGCPNITDQTKLFSEYMKVMISDCEIVQIHCNVPIKFKSFGTYKGIELWGLENLKETILPFVNDFYHTIQFFYDPKEQKNLANWTYNDTINGAILCEFPTKQSFVDSGATKEVMKHEQTHALYRILNHRGIPNMETIDIGGDVSNNLDSIYIYRNIILDERYTIVEILKKIIPTINSLIKKIMSTQNKIKDMALAIQSFEGYYGPSDKFPEGSLSYRNNNPGNIRYNLFVNQYLGGSLGIGGFAKWETYEHGLDALIGLLTWAAQGKIRNYKPDMTLVDFFNVYAPSSDNNNPDAYADFVAKKLSVDPNEKIKNLL